MTAPLRDGPYAAGRRRARIEARLRAITRALSAKDVDRRQWGFAAERNSMPTMLVRRNTRHFNVGFPRYPARAAHGQLPRLTLVVQSGGCQARRLPRRSTLGPDREGEQPTMSGLCRIATKADVEMRGCNCILTIPILTSIALRLDEKDVSASDTLIARMQ